MSEQNQGLIRLLTEEVMNKGNYDVVDELVAADYAGHSSMAENRGTEGYKQFFVTLRDAFPDIHCTIEDLFSEGEKVVSRWSARGTHTGMLAGLAPTGRDGVVTGISVFRVSDGKVAECWTNFDHLGLLRLIDAIPTAPTA